MPREFEKLRPPRDLGGYVFAPTDEPRIPNSPEPQRFIQKNAVGLNREPHEPRESTDKSMLSLHAGEVTHRVKPS